MKCRLSLIVLCFATAMPALGDIVIEGTVKLPPPKPAPAAAGRYQQKSGSVATPSPPSAVVYLEGSFPNSPAKNATLAVIEQKSFQFDPGVLPVQKGAQVEFPNHDDDYHHVFSYSKTKEFDLGRYRKDEKPAAVKFDKPGVVKIGCEIHDHMRATILVLDTPYFKKTDSDGNYRLTLANVPAGKYVLKAWVNERTIWEQPVELKDGVALKVNFPNP